LGFLLYKIILADADTVMQWQRALIGRRHPIIDEQVSSRFSDPHHSSNRSISSISSSPQQY